MSDNGQPLVDFSIDDLSQQSANGSISNAIANNLYGINHRQTPSAIPINKDLYGLTFFTRPQLNFTSLNLRNVRTFLPLLTTKSLSYQRAIRCLLDPRLGNGFGSNEAFSCDFVDNTQAFIPVLTNHLTSISGWQDIRVPTFTGKAGAYKDEYSMVDGTVVDYTAYDITATFRNSRGDIITNLFFYWAHYMAAVFEGSLMPYGDFITENEIDYQTRIYRLILDPSKTKVQRIGACGAAFPAAVPVGGVYDFSNEKPYNDSNKEITIPFRCMGAIYNDDILVHEFNQTVCIFNPMMRDDVRPLSMLRIPAEWLTIFNHRGYARISPQYDLEWWIPRDLYDAKINAINSLGESFGLDNMVDRFEGGSGFESFS